MKLKHDFITNSSTTAYMIVIPKDFSVDKYLSIREQAGYGELNPELIKKVKTHLYFMERDGLSSIFSEYTNNQEILEFFQELGLLVGNVEIDGSEGVHLILISSEIVTRIERQFLEKTNANKK